MERYNATTETARTFTHGPSPLAGIANMVDYTEAGQTHDFHYDHRGTVTSLTDGAGEVAQTYEHDAWGVRLSATGELENPIQYQGCAWLKAADLCSTFISAMRRYEADSGRFAQGEPVSPTGLIRRPLHDGGWYGYVRANPLSFVDPLGAEWKRLPGNRWKYCSVDAKGSNGTDRGGGGTEDAESGSGSLRALAKKITTYEEDWVCIWPDGDRALWTDYPTAADGATADASNLMGDTPLTVGMYAWNDSDSWIKRLSLLFPKQWSWRTGKAAALRLQELSAQGANPIYRLILAGHGAPSLRFIAGTTEVLRDEEGKRVLPHTAFQASDLFVVADEKNNSKNTLSHAFVKIGPPRCWFSRYSTVCGFACFSNWSWAPDWASKVARKSSRVRGLNGQPGELEPFVIEGRMIHAVTIVNSTHLKGWGYATWWSELPLLAGWAQARKGTQ